MNENIKVCVILNSGVGKVNDSIYVEASLPLLFGPLIDSGYQVNVAAYVLDTCSNGTFAYSENSIKLLRLNPIVLKDKFLKIFNYLFSVPGIFMSFFNSNIFYIFLPGNYGFVYGLLSFLLRKDYALYVRGDLLNRNKFLTPFYKILISKSKFNFCTGNTLVEFCRNFNDESFQVVPMSFLLKDSTLDFRRDSFFGLRLLYVGQITKEKGIMDLLCAVKIVKDFGLNINLTIVGSGQLDLEVKKYILDNGLDFNVVTVGSVTSHELLKKHFEESDIFCLPSYTEGFPRVLYESFLYKLIIISTNVGSIMDVLVDNYNALIFEPGDVFNLSRLLKLVCEDMDLRIRLIRGAGETWNSLGQTLFREKDHGTQVCIKLKELYLV